MEGEPPNPISLMPAPIIDPIMFMNIEFMSVIY